MAISQTTRTHLIYQFIILTLLFLAIGYNELLPDRKFVLFMAFIPMFCYQLLILSCCMELMPVPSWMQMGESAKKKAGTKTEEGSSESLPSSPESTSSPEPSPKAESTKEPTLEFADLSERIHPTRRWEKSVVNLGVSPKMDAFPKKSKSWVNLSGSRDLLENSLSREGSLDVLAPLSERKLRNSHMSKASKLNYKEKRSSKAKSWKPSFTDFNTKDTRTSVSEQRAEFPKDRTKPPLQCASAVQEEDYELAKSYSFPFRKKRQAAEQLATAKQDFCSRTEATRNDNASEGPQEEIELSKSYSFPFRQKRLETWLELKETGTRESNQSLDMPYWQTMGYSLAVKYEARRRRRAVSSPTKSEAVDETPRQNANLQKSVEIQKDSAARTSKSDQRNANFQKSVELQKDSAAQTSKSDRRNANFQKSVEIQKDSTAQTSKSDQRNANFHKSVEIQKDSATQISRSNQKKTVKTTTNCINKLKTTFTNIFPKKKEEGMESTHSSKALKPTLSFRSKTKITIPQTKIEAEIPPMPQFLSSDRPLLFYPKYIPFEKERFESDVQKKMLELAEEQKVGSKCL